MGEEKDETYAKTNTKTSNRIGEIMRINYHSLFFVIMGIVCMYSGVTLNNMNEKPMSKIVIAFGVLLMVIANILNNKGLI